MGSKLQRLKLVGSSVGKGSFMLVIAHSLPTQQVSDNFALMSWFRLHTRYGEIAEITYAYMVVMGIEHLR